MAVEQSGHTPFLVQDGFCAIRSSSCSVDIWPSCWAFALLRSSCASIPSSFISKSFKDGWRKEMGCLYISRTTGWLGRSCSVLYPGASLLGVKQRDCTAIWNTSIVDIVLSEFGSHSSGPLLTQSLNHKGLALGDPNQFCSKSSFQA